MGTRGAVGFRSDNQDKVRYNHFDSYPDGLGKEVLHFIQGETPESLKQISSGIVIIDESIKPTPEQIKECKPWTDLSVSNQSTEDWYCLLRGSQGDLSAYRNGLKYMPDSSSFLQDSLFCEYAYIINTDENTLEFYSGFNQKARKNKGRYAGMQDTGNSKEYYGVAQVAKFPLDEICGASDEKLTAMIAFMSKKAESFYNNQERELKKNKSGGVKP